MAQLNAQKLKESAQSFNAETNGVVKDNTDRHDAFTDKFHRNRKAGETYTNDSMMFSMDSPINDQRLAQKYRRLEEIASATTATLKEAADIIEDPDTGKTIINANYNNVWFSQHVYMLFSVEVIVLDDFSGIDDSLIKGESVTLMGKQALSYVRSRKGLEDSSNLARMERQKQYVKALYEKLDSRLKEDETFTLTAFEKMSDHIVYDVSEQRIQKLADKFADYEFLGIRTFEGESVENNGFMEFHPDEDSVWEIVLDLFYEPIKNHRPRS